MLKYTSEQILILNGIEIPREFYNSFYRLLKNYETTLENTLHYNKQDNINMLGVYEVLNSYRKIIGKRLYQFIAPDLEDDNDFYLENAYQEKIVEFEILFSDDLYRNQKEITLKFIDEIVDKEICKFEDINNILEFHRLPFSFLKMDPSEYYLYINDTSTLELDDEIPDTHTVNNYILAINDALKREDYPDVIHKCSNILEMTLKAIYKSEFGSELYEKHHIKKATLYKLLNLGNPTTNSKNKFDYGYNSEILYLMDQIREDRNNLENAGHGHIESTKPFAVTASKANTTFEITKAIFNIAVKNKGILNIK
jgi:hypothetical protein